MQVAVALDELVKRLVECVELGLQGCIVGVAQLLLQNFVHGLLHLLIVLEALFLGLSLYLRRIEGQRYGHTSL